MKFSLKTLNNYKVRIILINNSMHKIQNVKFYDNNNFNIKYTSSFFLSIFSTVSVAFWARFMAASFSERRSASQRMSVTSLRITLK